MNNRTGELESAKLIYLLTADKLKSSSDYVERFNFAIFIN